MSDNTNHTRKIKADYIEYDGDYVHIVRRPMRRLWFIVVYSSFLMALIILTEALDFFGINPGETLAFLIIIFSVIGCIVIISIGGLSVYTIPRVDISVIKEYPDQEKVTVVFDEDRTKSRLFLNE